jgi:hypothetical protein
MFGRDTSKISPLTLWANAVLENISLSGAPIRGRLPDHRFFSPVKKTRSFLETQGVAGQMTPQLRRCVDSRPPARIALEINA